MVRVMVFSATFNNMSIVALRKPEYPEKNTDLTDDFYHIKKFRVHFDMRGIRTCCEDFQ